MKSSQTRRQHHVAQFYLRGWGDKGRFFCLQDNRIFPTNVRDAAVQRDFYKLNPLDEREVEFVRLWIEQSPPASRRVHENFLRMFSEWSTLKALVHEQGVHVGEDLADALEERIINAEEEYHAAVEGACAPFIEEMRVKRTTEFYSRDEDCGRFMHFLALQLFRTKAVKDRVIARMNTMEPLFDISNCWNIVSHIIAVNVGATLFLERRERRIILLENRTTVPFVTGDMPIFNLLTERYDSATSYSPFYPLSPDLAMILTDVDGHCRYSSDTLDHDAVRAINRRIATNALAQVFARTELPLRQLQTV